MPEKRETAQKGLFYIQTEEVSIAVNNIKALKKHEFNCSMSRKGNCWDNAPMESFWGKLKQERLNGQHFRTREEAKVAVFWYIEVYYHRKRLHAGNGYRTPMAATVQVA